MSTIDQQFVEFVVKSLVGKPDAVKIERRIDEKGVLLELTVDPEDLGRVIGKRGATAQSLRTLLRALGTKNDARYNLKIVDNGMPRAEREERQRDEEQRAEPRKEAKRHDEEQTASAPAATSDNDTQSDDTQISDDEDEEPETKEDTEDHSSVVSKTRKELEELDDLDL